MKSTLLKRQTHVRYQAGDLLKEGSTRHRVVDNLSCERVRARLLLFSFMTDATWEWCTEYFSNDHGAAPFMASYVFAIKRSRPFHLEGHTK